MSTDGRTPRTVPRIQRPRVTLMIPEKNAYQDGMQQQHSPYLMTAATSAPSRDQPDWPNPVLQQLYAQKAGDFVFKQFEGLNRFTRGGLSLGEKSVVWMYAKFRSWSRNWFTHCFLFIVMILYTVAGGAIFMAFEGLFVVVFLISLQLTASWCRSVEHVWARRKCERCPHKVILMAFSNVNRNLTFTVLQFHAVMLIKITTRHFVSCAIDLGFALSVKGRKCLI